MRVNVTIGCSMHREQGPGLVGLQQGPATESCRAGFRRVVRRSRDRLRGVDLTRQLLSPKPQPGAELARAGRGPVSRSWLS